MSVVDKKTRRAWPPYWSAHKIKAIRTQVIQELTTNPGEPVSSPGSPSAVACATRRACSEKDIRLETARRWAAYCMTPRDLDEYRAEANAAKLI